MCVVMKIKGFKLLFTLTELRSIYFHRNENVFSNIKKVSFSY